MQLELLNDKGQSTEKVEAPDTVFARDYNEALVHQIVVAYQANARLGTRAQLDRGTVKHSTKKPFRQKGTGRARRHDVVAAVARRRSDLPNSPDENFSQKVNKKMYRAGMASIFSQLVREGRLSVIESLTLDAPKTKLLAQKFKDMGVAESVLVITHETPENLMLASRNLANVLVIEPRYADPLALVHYKKVLVTKGAMEQLKEMLA